GIVRMEFLYRPLSPCTSQSQGAIMQSQVRTSTMKGHDMDESKGLFVRIIRSSFGDCTGGGVSSRYDSFVLVSSDRALAPFKPDKEVPALFLSSWMRRLIACPENLGSFARSLNGWAFGGNYVDSSDSRFPSPYPIPIYDARAY